MKPYYDEDGITIYHGKAEDVLPLLSFGPQVLVGAIVTDPPYGLGAIMDSPGYGNGKRQWTKLWVDGAQAWDAQAPELVASLPEFSNEVIIWGGNHFNLPPARGWLVWDKIVRNFSSGHCELAWTNLDQPVRAFNYAHAQLASEGKHHPTQKPLDLMRWCLGFIESEAVIDPFMGSGTTLVAAHDLGKRAIGIEVEEKYCEIAVQRLAQGVLEFS